MILDELEELAEYDRKHGTVQDLERVTKAGYQYDPCVQRGIRRAYLKETLQSRRLFKSPYI